MGKGLRAFLLFPWNVTMFPNAFGGQMVGAIFLAFLPVLVLFWKKPRAEAHRIAFFTAAFIAFLFSQSQHVRFFIAAMPLLAVGTGVSIVRVLERGRLLRITAASTLVILIGLHAGIFVWRSRDSWPVVLGRTSAADSLAEHERSYRGFDFLKNHVPADASVLNAAEVRYFYSPDGWRITHLPHLLVTLRGQGASIETHLREARYEYVWVSNQSDPVILEYLRREAYQPIFHYDFAEKPDTFQNTIYRRVSQFSL